MKNIFVLLLKGFGMGAANVIPGVSGGTVALITGIFERIIDAVKSFNLKALQLILKGKFKAFAEHTDLFFLVNVFTGAVLSVFSLAKLLDFLFQNYPVQIWSYFFGLILASVYFVARTIDKATLSVVLTFITGTAIAVAISVLSPASSNDSFLYLILCGVVAICSMILPGLSGSFVLLLMGNYKLVMIDAVSELNLQIIAPVGIGAVVGLIAFSHFLSWIYKKYKNETISSLTGFIFGSLLILWPWKNEVFLMGADRLPVLKEGEKILKGYNWYIPEISANVAWAIVIILGGIATIWLMEKMAAGKESK